MEILGEATASFASLWLQACLVADLKADFVVVAAVDAAGCWEVPMYRLKRGLQTTAYYERKESFRH